MSTLKSTSRRPRGTGSIEIKNGIYYGRWRQNGRPIKRSLGPVRTPGRTDGLTQAMAETKLRKLMDDNAPPIIERITVAEAGDRHIARRELLGREPSTLRSYRNVLNRQIKPRVGDVPIAKLERRHVEAMIDDLAQDGYTPKTIRNIIGILSGICRHAAKQGWATRNACDGVELPKVRSSTDIRYLTLDELDLMLHAVDEGDYGRVYRAAYLTAALSGLRSGEIRGLRWRDIDWTAQKIHVRQNRVRKHTGNPKTSRSSRAVPLATRVAAELDQLSRTTEFSGDDDLVFANLYTGDPLDGDALLQALYRAEERAGVRRVTFHELRHTFGTQAAAAGVPLVTLQAWMGHEHISTTMIYAHYAPGQREAEMLDAAFATRAADRATAPAVAEPSTGRRSPAPWPA